MLGGWAETGREYDDLANLKDWESDPILVQALERVQTLLGQLRQAETTLTLEIIDRLRRRGGSEMVDGFGLVAALDVGREWVCNLEVLADLQAYLTPEEWDRVAPQPPQPERRPNKTVANQLAKRGGPIRDIIDAAYSEVPTQPKVRVKRATRR